MRLDELLNTPEQWTLTTKEGSFWQAEFQVDDIEYGITLDPTRDDRCHVFFYVLNHGDPGSAEQVLAVMSTVLDIVQQHIKETHTAYYWMTADTPSRAKLYLRLCNRFGDVQSVEAVNGTTKILVKVQG